MAFISPFKELVAYIRKSNHLFSTLPFLSILPADFTKPIIDFYLHPLKRSIEILQLLPCMGTVAATKRRCLKLEKELQKA